MLQNLFRLRTRVLLIPSADPIHRRRPGVGEDAMSASNFPYR